MKSDSVSGDSKDGDSASEATLRIDGGTKAAPLHTPKPAPAPIGDETIAIPGGTAAVHPSGGYAMSVEETASGRIVTRKYAVEREVARGGMGAILRVTDLNIKREVAMKVMLGEADPVTCVRFIEEARITGRLEHPNIVPVHDLGIDDEGRHYFTMKLVNGRTLGDLLDEVRIKKEKGRTLTQFLQIFINTSHAVAFAHSRGVIHRDLKPANIMIGDFGEVLVMDWGLAKVKAAHGQPAAAPHAPVNVDVNANTTDTSQTLQGTIIGTPAYMSPEQARGDIEHIDERSDIYALGAVLYEILTLKPPVEGKTIAMLLGAAAAGNIALPEYRSPELKDNIPPELAAIAMKALATQPEKRYRTVDELITDIHLYMEGRSVSAKEDTAFEAFRKLINRNRAVSLVGGAAFATLLIFGIISHQLNSAARARAETQRAVAEKHLENLRDEQQRRRTEQKNAAPAFLGRAKSCAEARDFAGALQDVAVALSFDPELPGAHLLKAQIHIVKSEFSDALAELDIYSKLKPEDTDAFELKQICKGAGADVMPAMASALADIFMRQQAFGIAESMHLSVEKQLEVYRQKVAKAWPDSGAKLFKDHDGHCVVDLNRSKLVTDLSPLKDIPVQRLQMQETGVRDLKPLEGMALTHLLMEGTAVNDLTPLKSAKLEVFNAMNARDLRDLQPLEGMPIRFLNVSGCRGLRDIGILADMPLTDVNLALTRVRDIAPLAGLEIKHLYLTSTLVTDLSPIKLMPLEGLWLGKTNVMDLSTLKGQQLKTLSLYDCEKISDLSPLKGMPLEDLAINGSKVSDLTPLQGMKLKAFSFTPKNITKGLDLIRSMDTLREIGITSEQRLESSEFWKRYDAGEFKN